MPASQPGSPSLDEILTSRRMGAVFGALTDPTRGGGDDALSLSGDERYVIRQAVEESPHPLAGFAHLLIDLCDDTAADDRVAGLFLLREITVGEKRQRDRDLGRSSPPGLSR